MTTSPPLPESPAPTPTQASPPSRFSFDNLGFVIGLIWIGVFFFLFIRETKLVPPLTNLPQGLLEMLVAIPAVATFLLIIAGVAAALKSFLH